jgi:hypothetical protein
MFCPLDVELFPDLCEVAEMPLHGQWVYMIQKNGTSSIRDDPANRYRILVNQEISHLEHVDVYVRNPKSRYISGVNTFVQHILRQNPDLDRNTLIWISTRYLFLNRHYLPQILWLINLSRYLNTETKLRIRDFRDYHRVVSIDHDARVIPASEDMVNKILSQQNGIDLWFFADQILLDLAGNHLTWQQILSHYRTQHKEVWDIITGTARKLQHVLC